MTRIAVIGKLKMVQNRFFFIIIIYFFIIIFFMAKLRLNNGLKSIDKVLSN